MSRERILVVGGSIAGLLAGILLARAGCRVDVFERAGEALAGRGAGITTHDELYAALDQAGIDLTEAVTVESLGRALLDRDGTVLATRVMPQLMTSWGMLYRLLRRRFPDAHYHPDATVTGIRLLPDGVELELADGRRERGDWLIGADGMRSTVRSTLWPEVAPRYAGYVAWRGLAEERALPAAVRDAVADRFLLCLPPGEHMLGYFVAGPNDVVAPGRRWYNWVWYRPAPAGEQLERLLTGSDGRHYPDGIPHHLIRGDLLDTLGADAVALLAPPLAAAVTATPTPFLQPILDLASPALIDGRALLLGDAAFTARPHVGLGVSKAADDAARLARAFAAADRDAALAQWERDRVAFGSAAVAHSADLGSYLDGSEPRDAADAERRRFFRSPETVLDRIAARDPYRFLGDYP